MKTVRNLALLLTLSIFLFLKSEAGNDEKKFPPLTNTKWIYKCDSEQGKTAIIFTFLTDSTFTVEVERKNKSGSFFESKNEVQTYKYDYPNILFDNAKYHGFSPNSDVLSMNNIIKGIRKKDKIEVFKDDGTSFVLEKWYNKK